MFQEFGKSGKLLPRTVIFDLKNNIGQVKRSLNYPEIIKSQSDKVAEAKEVWFVNSIIIYILYCVGVKILKSIISKSAAKILMKIKNLKVQSIRFRRDYTIIKVWNNL